MSEHPSTPGSRLLRLLGFHDWVQGRHVRYCRRCYAT